MDGFVRGAWKTQRERHRARLRVEPFETIAASERGPVADEGARLLAFAASDAADRDVDFAPPV